MALPMTLPFGLFLDLVGIFVFGLSGAMLAVRRDLDLFGIAVLALATGLAGGVIRDALLGATPVAALSQPLYIWAALASALCVYLTYERLEKLNNPVMLMDALGLGLLPLQAATRRCNSMWRFCLRSCWAFYRRPGAGPYAICWWPKCPAFCAKRSMPSRRWRGRASWRLAIGWPCPKWS